MPRVRSTHDDKAIAVGYRRAASKAARLVEKLLDRADELREKGDDKGATFAARAAQATAIAGGVSYDKSRLAEDRPTVIHGDDRDAEDILRSLAALGVIDTTAEEIPTRPALPASASEDPGAELSDAAELLGGSGETTTETSRAAAGMCPASLR